MDRFKGMAKKGWHPEKEGGIRNSVKGMIGKGDSSKSSSYSSEPYVKKDPSNYAPPPTTRRYGEGERPVPAPRTEAAQQPAALANKAEREEPTYERGPFVVNKTGKDMSKFAPPPPTRRAGEPVVPSASSSSVRTPARPQVPARVSATTPSPSPAQVAKPNLPPRLPPRNPSSPAPAVEQTASNGQLQQTAISRLGSSGINVAALGIGGNHRLPGAQASATAVGNGSTAPSTGTTWAEKQAAIKTAQQLRANPNAVSAAELRSAATTAHNFQARHGEQVASGLQSAQQANQRYNIAERVGQLSVAGGAGSGKAPPPIPAKKVGNNAPGPPPLPMGSKPRPV